MKSVAIYHTMRSRESFEKTAQALFRLVQKAQSKFPDQPRCLYLDIEGHRNPKGGYDRDALEIQKEFLVGFLSQYLHEFSCPLVRAKTPSQSNDIPEILLVTNMPACSEPNKN